MTIKFINDFDNLAREVFNMNEVHLPLVNTGPLHNYQPLADAYELQTSYMYVIDVPGASPKDITLSLVDGELKLAYTTATSEPKDNTLVRLISRERMPHKLRYERVFRVPVDADSAQISAQLTNGVLCIQLPKLSKAAPRTITIIS
jgi:HSP20 family protein